MMMMMLVVGGGRRKKRRRKRRGVETLIAHVWMLEPCVLLRKWPKPRRTPLPCRIIKHNKSYECMHHHL
jgi:hypothetical protein